jgi:hypothetical protein
MSLDIGRQAEVISWDRRLNLLFVGEPMSWHPKGSAADTICRKRKRTEKD